MVNKLCHYLYCVIACIVLFACTDKRQEKSPDKKQRIQAINVTNRIALTNTDQGFFYYPRFSPDGSKILFTSSNYIGLSYYDLRENRVVFLNNMAGAGFDICFSSDNSAVFFKTDTTLNRRRYYNLFKQDFESKNLLKLNKNPLRKVAGLSLDNDDNPVYWADKELMLLDMNSNEPVPVTTTQKPYYNISGNKLVIYKQGNYHTYNSFPGQNLIWIDPIPESHEVLVYVVGHGLYKFNPQENSSILLGDFRAARCAPDGRLIAYMREEDDGLRLIRSDIFVATLDEQKIFPMTDTQDEIEMYPDWSPDGRQLVFHTNSGTIELITLEIK